MEGGFKSEVLGLRGGSFGYLKFDFLFEVCVYVSVYVLSSVVCALDALCYRCKTITLPFVKSG